MLSEFRFKIGVGFVLLSTVCLAACTPSTTSQTELDSLPLTPETRADLETALSRVSAAGAGPDCSKRELEFTSVSLTLFAVGVDQALTQDWSASEQAQFDALMERWRSLGGDDGDVSATCRNRLASLELPIM